MKTNTALLGFLNLAICALLGACGGGGEASSPTSGATPSQTVTPSPGVTTPPVSTGVPLDATILLGQPTTNSIKLKIESNQSGGAVSISYGSQVGSYSKQTQAVNLTSGTAIEILLSDLQPDTRYYYRINYQTPSGSSVGPEYRFQTARPAGSSFTFTVQADSHLDENSDLEVYRRTLQNVLADSPDFHIDLGDTFMTEKYSQPLVATLQAAADFLTVDRRYQYEKQNFGLITHSVPLFLVNGNHDGELGWLLNGTAQNLAIWATQARKQHFLNPLPDAFYKGDSYKESFVGERAAWYAWTWGDALFIALDPYWNSQVQSNKDGWNLTLGDRQYRWLAETLANSSAKYKFVFLHNLVGGLDGQMRGGVEAAPYFEWGGKNLDGTNGFATKRPGWALPIHSLLVQNRVTAVFHGHDHLYAKQELDGIIYQTVPQPSAKNFSSGPTIAKDYHYDSGTIVSSSGHLRVKVTPTGVSSEYVRSWLPAQETSSRTNRQVDDKWAVGLPK